MKQGNNYKKMLIAELEVTGHKFKDANDIFHQKELSIDVVNTILKWLPKLYEDRGNWGAADILVRSLIGSKEPFDPTILIDLFDNTNLNFSLKDSIALTLAYAKTTDISIWLKDQLLNKDYALERITLIDGLNNKGRFTSERELIEFLYKIFDKYPTEEILKLLKEFGTYDDVLFLEQKSKFADVKFSKQITKTINLIKKRLSV